MKLHAHGTSGTHRTSPPPIRPFRLSTGDGPGVRIGSIPSAVGALNLSASTSASAGSVRFMSMFGGHRTTDPVTAEAIAKYF